jgi:predicted DsbA family dithiol-disulfide isomerase
MRPPRGFSHLVAATAFFLISGCDGKDQPKSAAADLSKPAEPAQPTDTASLPGIELDGLDPGQVKMLNRLLDEKPSACGKNHSLRTSLKTDPACKRSLFAGRYLVFLIKNGLLPSEAEEAYDKRFVAPEMGHCDPTNAPMRGNGSAPVTICEFSDFQCPHCKMVEPILARLLDEYRDQLRLIYKSFPLSRLHPEASDAAAAAVAAGKQGKFWPMHDRLFANQDKLTQADLLRYATDLKLDTKKWKADLTSSTEQVEHDRAEGDKLELTGTPTLYINDRKYAGPLRYEVIKDWIDEELNR